MAPKRKAHHACRGCHITLKDQVSADNHERCCPKMKLGKYDSFLKHEKHCRPRSSTVNYGKVALPSSQTSKPSNTRTRPPIIPALKDLMSDSHAAIPPQVQTTESRPLSPSQIPLPDDNFEEEEDANEGQRETIHTFIPENENNNENNHAEEDVNCPICRVDTTENEDCIVCDMCHIWSHRRCLYITEEEFRSLRTSDAPWYCAICLSIRANNIRWGTMQGEVAIRAKVTSIYDEVTKWRKNLFMTPRGKAGTDFIKTITKLIQYFTNSSKWSRLSLALVHIFIPLMLQKPSSKSKAKDHSKYLEKRMKLWNDGDLDSIMAENREIQKRLKHSQDKKKESKQKLFCRLMLQGKVSQAMKFVDSENDTRGVHPLTEEIKEILQEKHPEARDVSPDILLTPTATEPEPVIFEEINGISVYNAAKKIQGSGGANTNRC